jgi:parallel beta-helix repeat protein
MRNTLAIITSVLLVSAVHAGGTLDVSLFGAFPDDNKDDTLAVRAALTQAKKQGAAKLVFPKGRYDFYPDKAFERYQFVSNNDEGLKRIAFPLDDVKGFEIDGQGSDFLFHGFLSPFAIDHSSSIVLRGFTVDYERTFHSEGKILAVTDTYADVEIPPEYPYSIENGLLKFHDGKSGKERTLYPVNALLEFDPVKRETAYRAWDYGLGTDIRAEDLGNRRIRVLRAKMKGTPGNIFVFGPNHRQVCGITITDSRDVTVEDVSLYHCGGMGVIGQRSRDLFVRRVKVTPAPGKNRIVSITADATHFVNCGGQVVLEDCLFELQKDDATNVHGIYVRIVSRLSPNVVDVKLVHPQQYGFDFIKKGQKLELVNGPALTTYAYPVVKLAERLNKEYTRLTFKEPLPDTVAIGDALAAIDDYAALTIRGCTIRGNRARGILLNSRGPTVVENNIFHTAGAAILFEGDARFWYEQAGVSDCAIRSNLFDNCNYGVWGRALIEVGAGIDPAFRATSRYNKNIRITGNTIRYFHPALLSLYSVQGVTFTSNKLEKTEAYPQWKADAPRFETPACDNVRIEE